MSRTSDHRPPRCAKIESIDAPKTEGFPPGTRVKVDGNDDAVVAQHFPAGSTSYMFPHYKVHFVDGDRNVAVHASRVGTK
jgi:hypothetical protein